MRNTQKRLIIWAVAVACLLTVPLIAKWPWTVSDYIFGAIMLFGAATVYELATRRVDNSIRRLAIGAAVFLVLAVIWIGAATGYGHY